MYCNILFLHLLQCILSETTVAMMPPAVKRICLRVAVPICVILSMAYAEWAYSYRFCYQDVYKRSNNKPAMLGFIIISNILLFSSLAFWIIIVIKGAGEMPTKIPPYDLEKYVRNGSVFNNSSANSTFNDVEKDKPASIISSSGDTKNNEFLEPPEIFECDQHGLPSWCSECGSLKLLRSHHSSIHNKCIPMFDHYCRFVGTTIGKNNYIPFWCFLVSIETLMAFTVITIIVFSGIWNRLNAALIVYVVLAGVMAILTGHLVYAIARDLYQGDTSIERLQRTRVKMEQRKAKRARSNDIEKVIVYDAYVNVSHPNNKNLRAVVQLDLSDRPFKNGLKQNILLWLRNFNTFSSAEKVSDFQNSMYCEKFKRIIYNKIENNDCTIFGSGTKLESVAL